MASLGVLPLWNLPIHFQSCLISRKQQLEQRSRKVSFLLQGTDTELQNAEGQWPQISSLMEDFQPGFMDKASGSL